MLYLLTYLTIGGIIWTSIVIGNVYIQKKIQKVFKEENLTDSFEHMTAGFSAGLSLIIAWLPIAIGTIIITIYNKIKY